MDHVYQNDLDVEHKSRLKAGDVGQLVFTVWTFLSSLFIKIRYPHNSSEFSLWIEIMFYGSLIWLAFLLISMVSKYKDKNIRSFFRIATLIFFLFHFCMWGWLVHLWHKNKLERHFVNKNKAGDLFASVYLILGLILAIISLVGVIAWLWGRFGKRSSPTDNILDNYGEDYQEYHIYS